MLPELPVNVSPIRLLSDASSEGLPSPETLRNLLFSEQPHSQQSKKMAQETSRAADVIVLDDSPPVAQAKIKHTMSALDDLSNAMVTESTAAVPNNIPTPKSLSANLERVSSSARKGKRKLDAESIASQKEIKERARIQKKRERELAKAQKEAEKQRLKNLKEVNAIRTYSTDTLHDTIICLEKSLHDAEVGQAIKAQFEGKEAEIIPIDEEIENIIRWKIKKRADWDSSSQSFIPFHDGETRVVTNKHVAVWMDMAQLTTMILADELTPHLKRMQSRFTESQIVLIVEGLQKYYREQKNIQSKNFQKSVLQSIASHNGKQRGSSTSKKSKSGKLDWIVNGPDRNTIEDVMLSLQLSNRIMIIHTVDSTATGSWIAAISATIATKSSPSDLLDFCAEGRTTSGIDLTDTWLKMLQNIQMCTDAVSKAIVREYPTVYSLYDAYKRCKSVQEAETLLADIQVEQSVLSERDRYVNKAMSKKIYSILMSDDNKMVIA